MARKQLTIEEAQVLADSWQTLAENAKLSGRFADASPSSVVDMWGSGRNEKGKHPTRFETQALVERWCEIFGSLPPADAGTANVPAFAKPSHGDGDMLRVRDVVRLTGLSNSAIKRKVADGTFPTTRVSLRARVASAVRAGQVLKDLAREGQIRVRASKTGSVVTLVPQLVQPAREEMGCDSVQLPRLTATTV